MDLSIKQSLMLDLGGGGGSSGVGGLWWAHLCGIRNSWEFLGQLVIQTKSGA